MKKKNVVKRDVREKKTHPRSILKSVSQTPEIEAKAADVQIAPVVPEKEVVRKQPKKPKNIQPEPAAVENITENNEQNN